MSSQVQAYRRVAVVLDHLTVALLSVPEAEIRDSHLRHVTAKLLAADSADDGAYTPAQSIQLNRDAVFALRAALIEHVPDPVGIDRSLAALGELVANGFSLQVTLPVSEDVEGNSQKLKQAMKMLGAAGFNITTDDSPRLVGVHVFEATPPEALRG